jgi:disulfide bond formation protein DsbB
MHVIVHHVARRSHYLAWTVALLSVVVSLYLSDIMGFTPCNLCWYARILMYPLVVIIGLGIIRRDRNWVVYAAPLIGAGWLLELYHSLLQWGVIPETLTRCTVGVPCTTKYIDYLGFVTIPFMGLMAFTALGVLAFAYHRTGDGSST